MTTWTLVQVIFDVIVLLMGVVIFIKLRMPPKDDPRLSRGLQLLQSKISILEDLSDRTDTQVTQLQMLLNQKAKDLQDQMAKAEQEVMRISQATQKSLEVAKIFQDKIPHKEIIERQNTLKYVKAAKLAHQGVAIEDISKQVDLSAGELELIVKVNRQNLQFAEDELPEWAQAELEQINQAHVLKVAPDTVAAGLGAAVTPGENAAVATGLGAAVTAGLGKPKLEEVVHIEDQSLAHQSTGLAQLGQKFRTALQTENTQKFGSVHVEDGVRKYEFPKVNVNELL